MIKILSVILCIISYNALAVMTEFAGMKLYTNGYVGYKYVTSSVKNTTIPSAPELGLELSLDINEHWSAYTQFAYDSNAYNSLVYSFLSYEHVLYDDLTVRINAGKLRHNTGLYNNTRINPRARPGVIVPQSIYWDSLSHILTSGEGVNLTLKYKNLELGYTIDNPVVTDPVTEATIWTGPLLRSINASFGSHQMATIKYSFDSIPLELKSSWTKIDLGNDNSPMLAYILPSYANSNQGVQFITTGGIYTHKDWTFSAEHLYLKPFYTNWFTDYNSQGLSFTIRKEITEHVSLYTNYNQYTTKPLVSTPYHEYSKDINIGVNYHQKNWMIGAEVHHINGSRWMNPADYVNNNSDYKEWWMVGLNAVYFF